MAKLQFFGYLSGLAGTRVREITLARPAVLRHLVPSTFPETNVIILINEKVGNLDTEVADKDTIVFMPILSGG